MKKPEEWPRRLQAWDRWEAFHIGVHRGGFNHNSNAVMTLFDTGELVLNNRRPCPDERGTYDHVGVTLTTSEEIGDLWTPTGLRLRKAWFQDSGQQHLLIDVSTGRAVRTDVVHYNAAKQEDRPNVPTRFAHVAAYIGGPGCHPVGSGKFVIRPTLREMPTAEVEQIREMETVFRAHMTLTDFMGNEKSTSGPLAYERALMASDWQALTDSEMLRLWQYGIARPRLEFDHLLTGAPQ